LRSLTEALVSLGDEPATTWKSSATRWTFRVVRRDHTCAAKLVLAAGLGNAELVPDGRAYAPVKLDGVGADQRAG
jgi:hypothetical protein